MAKPLTRAQALQNRAFLKALRRTGNIRLAACETGLKYGTVQHRRRAHPAFAQAWDAALAFAQARFHETGWQGPSAGTGPSALAARMLGIADAGIWRVAMQFVVGFTAIYSAIAMGNLPQIVAAVRVGDAKLLRMRVLRTGVASATFALPVGIIVAIFSRSILGAVRPEFSSGAMVLSLLALGQLIAVVTGPTGLAIAMLGLERTNLALSALRLLGTVVLAPMSTYFWGLAGLAACSASLTACHNIANTIIFLRATRE